MRTLLIGNPKVSWRSWLKEHRENADLLALDPADPSHDSLGRLTLFRGEKPIYTQFYGSLDPQRAPQILLTALAEGMPLAGEQLIVQLPPFRGGPLMRHVTMLMAQLLQPDRILVAEGTNLDLEGFPVGPELVGLEQAFPPMVAQAQRKAHWLKAMEDCVPHEVDLKRIATQGARLGSGRVLTGETLHKAGLAQMLHAEESGAALFLVTENEPSEGALARALDIFHCTRAFVAEPDLYCGLLCAFSRQSGEDFGFGFIQQIDFENRVAHVLSKAVPPAPVKVLKIGALRVDGSGTEHGEVRPWQV